MLDFNHNQKFYDKVNAHIDSALIEINQKQTKRDYIGASRLGVSCNRALQYEFLNVPKDEEREFSGRTLRIFAAGHVFEDLIINSPYAGRCIFCKLANSAIAAILAFKTSLYFSAKWFAAVATCSASSLQKATIEAKT